MESRCASWQIHSTPRPLARERRLSEPPFPHPNKYSIIGLCPPNTKTETQKSSKTWPVVTQLVCGGTGIHPQVLLDLQPTFLNTGLSRFTQGACLSLQLLLLSSPSPTTFFPSHPKLLVLLGPCHATSCLPALAHAGSSAWHTCPPLPWLCFQHRPNPRILA